MVSQVLSAMTPNKRCTMGRSQLLVFRAEKVFVDSMQMTATASTTGVHTLKPQRHPAASWDETSVG